jgi:hypothetical protein
MIWRGNRRQQVVVVRCVYNTHLTAQYVIAVSWHTTNYRRLLATEDQSDVYSDKTPRRATCKIRQARILIGQVLLSY